MQIPVTAVILTKNEARVIARTVTALREFQQVLVVDSLSNDGTQDIAAGCGADVVNFEWDGKYPKKKQWALDHPEVTNDWVLFVDADEYPSTRVIDEIRRSVINMSIDRFRAYDILVAYNFMGRELKYGHRVVKRALLHRNFCRFPVVDDLGVANMWEVEGHYQPLVDGGVGRLRGKLVHNDVDPLYDYIARHNRYSDWEAHLAVNPGARDDVQAARSRGGQVFDRLPVKPVVFFMYCYLLRLGFLDGRPGLNYAIALAFYYWQIGVKISELRREAGRI